MPIGVVSMATDFLIVFANAIIAILNYQAGNVFIAGLSTGIAMMGACPIIANFIIWIKYHD